MISKIISGICLRISCIEKKISGTTLAHPNPMLQDVLQKLPQEKLGNVEPSPTKPEHAHFQNKKKSPKKETQPAS